MQPLIASFEEEIDVFRTNSREYGYNFVVARKVDGPQQPWVIANLYAVAAILAVNLHSLLDMDYFKV